jgi:hypothetical protein
MDLWHFQIRYFTEISASVQILFIKDRLRGKLVAYPNNSPDCLISSNQRHHMMKHGEQNMLKG